MKEKLYNKDGFMWIMFAVFPPIGIFLMWKNKRYNMVPRIITSIAYLFYFLIICGTVGNKYSGLSFASEFIRMSIFFVLLPYIIVHWSKLYNKFSPVLKKYNIEDTSKNINKKSTNKEINNGINKVYLSYDGGYPECPKSFAALITRYDNQLIFLERNLLKEKFRINIDDILSIKHHHQDTGINKSITIAIRYKNSQIELLFAGGLLSEKNYSNLMSLVYSNNVKPFNVQRERKFNICMITAVAIILAVAFIITGINDKNNTATNTKPAQSQDSKSTKDASKTNTVDKNYSNDTGTNENSNTTQVDTNEDIPEDDGSIEEGMYKIGSDLVAGEYVIIANDDTGSAYMAITKDSTGNLDSIIGNENIANRTYVTVNSGEYLTIRDAKTYPLDKAPKVDTSSGTLPDGMYKAGVDISAGEYKINSPGDGYVEITTNSRHTLDGVISNDNFSGDKYVSIQNGQYLKLQRATLTLNK